jgi:hypothetical protein
VEIYLQWRYIYSEIIYSGDISIVRYIYSEGIFIVRYIYIEDISVVRYIYIGDISIVKYIYSEGISIVRYIYSGDISIVRYIFSGGMSTVRYSYSGGMSIVRYIYSGDISSLSFNILTKWRPKHPFYSRVEGWLSLRGGADVWKIIKNLLSFQGHELRFLVHIYKGKDKILALRNLSFTPLYTTRRRYTMYNISN